MKLSAKLARQAQSLDFQQQHNTVQGQHNTVHYKFVNKLLKCQEKTAQNGWGFLIFSLLSNVWILYMTRCLLFTT